MSSASSNRAAKLAPGSADPSSQAYLRARRIDVTEVRWRRPAQSPDPFVRGPRAGSPALTDPRHRETNRAADSSPTWPAAAAAPRRRAESPRTALWGSVMAGAHSLWRRGRLRLRGRGSRFTERREGEPSSSDIDGSVEVYGDGAGGGSAGRGRNPVPLGMAPHGAGDPLGFRGCGGRDLFHPTSLLRPHARLAPAVSSLISVPSSHRHDHRGSVLLVYVELTPLRALYYPFFYFDSNAAIYPSSEILGSETSAQYSTEGEIDMATAQQAATVVAFRELGYKVQVVELGALVSGILPGTPAGAALKVGDVISALDGVKVPTYLSLSKRLEGLAPGTTVHLVVSAYPAGKPRKVSLELGVFRATGTNTYDCFPQGKGTKNKILEFVTIPGGKPHPVACLGIYPQGSGGNAIDGTAFKVGPLPVKVNLSSEGIVGPSAGLAFTLGLCKSWTGPTSPAGGRSPPPERCRSMAASAT